MRTARRATPSQRLLSAAIVLPLLVSACLGTSSSDSGDSAEQRGDDIVSETASDKIAFDYFVSKGLTDVQAAGIVGNLDQESGMSPTIAQYGGGPGRGIAQWSAGARWDTSKNDNVAWYAAQQGASIDSLALQLDFIWYELTTFGYGYSELRAATTVTAAVTAFQDYYEICGACVSSNRVAHAEAALADFGGSSPPPPPGNTTCSVAGVEGVCIATSACAAMPGYTSTAGHCAGAASVECCTLSGSGSSSSSTSSSTSTSASSSSGSSSSGSSSSGSSSSGSSSSGSSSSSSSGASSSSSTSSSSGSPAPSCSVGGAAGTCIDTSVCAANGGVSTPGHCPGSASEECCTPAPSCSVGGVSGTCINTSVCAANGGTSTPGYCPGSASEECCTP